MLNDKKNNGFSLAPDNTKPSGSLIYRIIKRGFDVLFSAVLMIPVGILIGIFSFAIKLDDGGSVFYMAERTGRFGKTFKMFKLRSMKENAPDIRLADGSTYNGDDDPRVTRFGKFARKTSVDELPQIINILKGDMSLVGPRPERPFFVEKFREEIPRYMVKHQVRPGLTGWAQVKGYRGDTSIRKRIECDLYYIENWSIGFDIKIIFLTFFKGFVNKNAY